MSPAPDAVATAQSIRSLLFGLFVNHITCLVRIALKPLATLALASVAAALHAQTPETAHAPPSTITPGLYRLEPFDAAAMNELVPEWLKRKNLPVIPFVGDVDDVRHAVVSVEPASGQVKIVLLAPHLGEGDSGTTYSRPLTQAEYAFFGMQKFTKERLFFIHRVARDCLAWQGRLDPSRANALSMDSSEPGFCSHVPNLELGTRESAFVLQSSYELHGPVWMESEIGAEVSRFSLTEPRNYTDLVYLPRAVPLRVAPSSDAALSEVRPWLAEGSQVALRAGGTLRSTPAEWLQVDALGPDGEATSGWVDHLDVLPGRWVKQKQESASFRFEVSVAAGSDDDDSYQAWNAILAVDKKTGARQLLPGAGDGQLGLTDDLVSVVDANFDGYPDVMIRSADGGAGPNSSAAFYLFDPVTQVFVYNDDLSMLTQIVIDRRRKTISSASRNSCCSYSSSTYRFIGGKLTEIANRDESLSADGEWMVTTRCALRGKTLRCHSRQSKARGGDRGGR